MNCSLAAIDNDVPPLNLLQRLSRTPLLLVELNAYGICAGIMNDRHYAAGAIERRHNIALLTRRCYTPETTILPK